MAFQELTNKTIREKTEEIKRLHKENRSLKAMLSVRDSHIQNMHSSKHSEHALLLDKFQVLSERNAEIQQENVEQKLRVLLWSLSLALTCCDLKHVFFFESKSFEIYIFY